MVVTLISDLATQVRITLWQSHRSNLLYVKADFGYRLFMKVMIDFYSVIAPKREDTLKSEKTTGQINFDYSL